MSMRIDFVIVAFGNRREELESLADQLLLGSRAVPADGRVFIVLNDDLPAWEQRGVVFLKTQENTGFARGAGIGLSAGSGEYVFFINPDCIDVSRAVTSLGCRLHAGCGILVPRLVLADYTFGYSQYENWTYSFGRRISAILCSKVLARRRRTSILPRYAKAPGAFVVMERHIAEALGGPFDDSFFLYGEDRDMTDRARQKRIPVWFTPDIEVIHLLGGSFHSARGIVEYGRTDACLRIASRRHGRAGVLVYVLDMWLESHRFSWRKARMEQGRAARAALRRWQESGYVDPGRFDPQELGYYETPASVDGSPRIPGQCK